jgi:hypothetical protein
MKTEGAAAESLGKVCLVLKPSVSLRREDRGFINRLLGFST